MIIAKKGMPRHVAINLSSSDEVMELIKEQVSLDIPVLTINLPEGKYSKFFNSLSTSDFLHKHQVKVVVIGDWYDSEDSENVKQLMESTAKYDRFFLAFGLNYDGRKELLKAVRVLAKKLELKKLESINEESVKESLSSSYFVPPDIIIETATRYSGLLLWDSPGSVIMEQSKVSITKAAQHFKELQNI